MCAFLAGLIIAGLGFGDASTYLKTEDPVLSRAWHESAATLRQIASANDSYYLSGRPLEYAMGVAYLDGDSRLVGDFVSATLPDPTDPTSNMPDWPVLLERMLQWNGLDPAYRNWLEFTLDGWLETLLDRFQSDGLLRSGSTPMPESWQRYVADAAPETTQGMLESLLAYHGLSAAIRVRIAAGADVVRYEAAAEALRHGFHANRWDTEARLFKTAENAPTFSPWLNGLAYRAGLWPQEEASELVELIRREGTRTPPEFEAALIEACVRAGASQLALDLLSFVPDFERAPATRLIVEGFGGLTLPSLVSGTAIIDPRAPDRLESFRWSVHVPGGRVSIEYHPDTGFVATLPTTMSAVLEPQEGLPIMAKRSLSHEDATLSEPSAAFLESAGWAGNVGDGPGIWVSVDEQMLRLIENGKILYQARCATAEKGVGSQMNSLKTPLGWHKIDEKIGEGARWGQVFRSRTPTREVWRPGEDVAEDLVLTRILWLRGLEPGKNSGGRVDSHDRSIYIHGTNGESLIGTPSSHGCIRLSNDDVIEAFDRIPSGTPLLISDGEQF